MSAGIVCRLHALAARIDSILLAAEEDDEPGLGEKIGSISGAIGGTAAGAMLPTFARRTAKADAVKAAMPLPTKGAAAGFPEAFDKLKNTATVRNSPMATAAVEGAAKGAAATARGAVKVNRGANALLAKGGANARLIGGAVLGLGGYAVGKAIGRLADNLGYTQRDK